MYINGSVPIAKSIRFYACRQGPVAPRRRTDDRHEADPPSLRGGQARSAIFCHTWIITLSRVWFLVFVLCSHNTFQMVFIGFMFPFMVLQNFHHVFLFICSVRTLIKSSNFECTFCSVQHALSLTILPLQKLGMRELRRFSKG